MQSENMTAPGTQNFRRLNTFKEEFTSGGGSYINLGHYKSRTSLGDTAVEYKPSFLTHSSSTEIIKEPTALQGLHQTKFHAGFNRRQQSNIISPYTPEESRQMENFAATKAKRSAQAIHSRSQLLKDVDTRTGYDVITHELRGKGPTVKVEGIRSCGDGIGPQSLVMGKSTLRESGGRYFLPHASGHNADYRQDMLYREGLKQKKYSSVLGVGNKDMPSYGVEDQFSKSQYTKNSIVAQTGLHETRIPGKFTPRQVPSNPSGHKQIVDKWTTGVDINNNTMHCRGFH